MPGDYEVIHDGQLVVEYWAGAVTCDEILEHEKIHLADTSIMKHARCLVDMRNITSELSIKDIQEVVDMNMACLDAPKHLKIAIVCTDSRVYRQSQIFELSLFKHGVSIITFTSLSVACAWLDVDVVQVESTIDQLKNKVEEQHFHAA
ncbi:MAG: hypothetical protein CMJ19_07965 [Phycisphaeraceae bacterium]|nr:hypothetical protein [Phycisphaeraceae bacterium]|tara:strand:+ start:182 stop:625 length:444 start_codon:yes stop_codon:yes gene_type:complete